jgi:serine/threonine protein kinase
VVTLSSDSQGELIATKTARNQHCAELIGRELEVLKTLKHPLILELREQISDSQHNSMIVTEFAGSGSLADHLPPAEFPLSGANRIAKVIAGIALAMRFVHSRGIIHRDLRPDDILLDWDWKVRIADFGHSSTPDSPIDPNQTSAWPWINSRYLAPECYDNRCFAANDVFSFGLILYELLTGQPVFQDDLTQYGFGVRVALNDERPEIPEFVLPAARKLITDCWATEPDDRPSFEEIVDRLEEMKFKVFWNVNSTKLSAFVKTIKEWETDNAAVAESTPLNSISFVLL